jgi:hypothetical protein
MMPPRSASVDRCIGGICGSKCGVALDAQQRPSDAPVLELAPRILLNMMLYDRPEPACRAASPTLRTV